MTKFVYMKLLGLVLIVLGFSYCLTTFSNFFTYVYGDIGIADANIYIMGVGLLFPLYLFSFGIYFYFYTDREPEKINPFILISNIVLLVVGILKLFISTGIMQFIHISFAYVLMLCGLLLIYGVFKYKYWGELWKEKIYLV